MKCLQRLNRREVIQAAIGGTGLSALTASGTQTATTATMAMPANPVVETASGKVRGYSTLGVAVFRGIPYGASTTGENRFMPPAKPEPWPGVRNCLTYGHSCPEASTGPSTMTRPGAAPTRMLFFFTGRMAGSGARTVCG